jgi:hypothetical protein
MDPEQLYKLIKRQPFEPIKLHISDGSAYAVMHPDQLMIDRRTVYVGIQGRRTGPFQQVAVVSLIHITRVEPLNGSASKSKRKKTGS